MKKFTKLVSAIAFTSLAVLVGCANPTGGDVPNSSFGPIDVTKPEGFEPNKDSKSVTTEEDADKIIKDLYTEAQGFIGYCLFSLENVVANDSRTKDEFAKDEQHETVLKSKIANGENFTLTTEISIPAMVFNNTGIGIDYNLLKYYSKKTDTFDAATNKVAREYFQDGYYIAEIKNPKKLNVSELQNPKYIKSFKVSNKMKSHDKKTVPSSNLIAPGTNVTSEGSGEMYYMGVFQTDTFEGIVKVVQTIEGALDPSQDKLNITFYDLDGKETLKITRSKSQLEPQYPHYN